MRVKLNRGPMNGKYIEAMAGQSRIVVSEPKQLKPLEFRDGYKELSGAYIDEYYSFRRGEYVRSHRTLKNGAVVFEWLGWIDEG